MARLFEFQGKKLLLEAGIRVPSGELGGNPDECVEAFTRSGRPVVVKAQVWETDRGRRGGVRRAGTAAEVREAATEILSRFPRCRLLVEEQVAIARELYVGVTVDDRLRQPVLLLSGSGGSGIEDRERFVRKLVLMHGHEPEAAELRAFAAGADVPVKVAEIGMTLWRIARRIEARSLEINPLVEAADGSLVALDCHVSIDDYAVFRHPELEIEIARESNVTPTELDAIAWTVERDDYRGTFYFAELPNSDNVNRVGLHGCGGGGAMAAMDVLQAQGLSAANFADTSGNPPASKVYRAAKIILSQPGLKGYFLCGSGVASQEQTTIARGLIKAFREEKLRVPAVLRLGGNQEDEAERLMKRSSTGASVPVEVYKKFDSAEFCAGRLRDLIHAGSHSSEENNPSSAAVCFPVRPYSFATRTGRITYDHEKCLGCESKACVAECVPKILTVKDGLPILAISEADAARGRCTECLACEVECWYQGAGGASISLPIVGLQEYRERHAHSR